MAETWSVVPHTVSRWVDDIVCLVGAGMVAVVEVSQLTGRCLLAVVSAREVQAAGAVNRFRMQGVRAPRFQNDEREFRVLPRNPHTFNLPSSAGL